MLAFAALESLLSDLIGDAAIAATVTSVIVVVATFIVLVVLGRLLIQRLVRRALDRRNLDRHAQKPLLLLTRLTILIVAVGGAFAAAGVSSILLSLAGVAAALTLAVGFAMQNVIANLVAGIFIYADEPFRIGDWIEWDGYVGVVEDISLRVTRVRTFDNELLTVPNSVLTESVLKNPVEADRLRVRFTFGIGYGDDIEEATGIIIEKADQHPDILGEPAPSVRLTELGDSDVGLQARIWIADPSRSDVVRIRGEYVTAVKDAFDAADIDIPYPVRTLEGTLSVDEGA
ncbi:MAG: mechanosensitive ion channel family protein [Natrialbaceae archaeon]|nr:mechanosensitive ion channel family protein [Natrialbaceae archaeon]